MTLDEAIKHAEEVAEENEKSLRGWKECINRGTVGWSDFDKEKVDTSITRCSKCAAEHRQLVGLKELKQLRKQPKIRHCKDCKWWKDSDGVYRRGIGAESQCPINDGMVYEGNGYCYIFKPQERSDKK